MQNTKNNGDLLANEIKKKFSIRLLELLNKQGYKSSRKPYFVDIPRFSEDLNINPTMVRRYLSGSAIPQFHIIEKAANLLDVNPLWLYCGYKDHNSLNKKLFKKIFIKIEPILSKYNSRSEFNTITDYMCDIYNKVNALDAANELECSKLITWMIENITEILSTSINKETIKLSDKVS